MDGTFAWTPDEATIASSNLQGFLNRHGLGDYDALVERANGDPEWFWEAIFLYFSITFATPPDRLLDASGGIEWPRWCLGGRTNIVSHCIDRYRGTATWDKPAFIGEAEDGATVTLTYGDLDRQVSSLAALLEAEGVGRGDVVALYMPMIPEAAVAFFAVLKIGAINLPIFSGFGPKPIAHRIGHAEARAILTTDHAWRRGARVEMLSTVEQALAELDTPPRVVVLERDGEDRRDRSPDHVVWRDGPPARTRETEIVEADAPAMVMYTSGTTGAPKGTVHTHCGMLAKNALDMGLCVDMRADDRLLWMSDMGWIAGPKMVMSTALLGATIVMAEGTPTWPRPGRLFEMIDRHAISMLGTVPTIARQLMAKGVRPGEEYDLSSLRIVVSAGEPWTEDAWWWFFTAVCRRRIPILNYAGGTECGGAILIGTPLHPIRPGSFGGPVPGCGADIVEADGVPVPPGVVGELVMRRPTIGMTRGLWRDAERYVESYWRAIPGLWVQGDLASRDGEGLWYLHGRSDDVIKVAGKRTGPSEIESVVLGAGLARDCYIIGVTDAVTGSALVCAYAPLGEEDSADLAARIGAVVVDQCGSAYRPKYYLRVDDLPRTRNEKQMRRVVRSILLGHPVGDVSSCVNPECIDQVRSAARAQLPRL